MTTTGCAIDAFHVVRTLEVVREIAMRSRSIFGPIGGAPQTIAEGNITLFSERCEKTRAEACAQMLAHAEGSAPTIEVIPFGTNPTAASGYFRV